MKLQETVDVTINREAPLLGKQEFSDLWENFVEVMCRDPFIE